ncbi:MAG: Crp/Fnr family transcriptional regulator [Nitrospira sp.]
MTAKSDQPTLLTRVRAGSALMDCGAFADLQANVFRRLCPSAEVCTFRHKAVLYPQGRRSRHVWCLCAGQIKLARGDREGNELTIGFLSAGELFGPGLVNATGGESQETATAKGTVSAWRVPAGEFHALLLSTPALAVNVIEMLVRRQRQLERRLECFAFRRTEARLAETLRELSGGFEQRCEHGFGEHIRLTQQELADLVGATRPVVSTILNRLRGQGVLGYSRDYLCVRNIASIERLIGG